MWSNCLLNLGTDFLVGNMPVTRERINRTLELREILLSFQIGFSLVNAAVVCAILESISGLEPSTLISYN